MNQILLNANSSPEARAILINAKRMLTTARPDAPANALVVDGRTLTYALAKDLEELFVDVACRYMLVSASIQARVRYCLQFVGQTFC
jgi:hypothetical protein